jgi:hypothetical protein
VPATFGLSVVDAGAAFGFVDRDVDGAAGAFLSLLLVLLTGLLFACPCFAFERVLCLLIDDPNFPDTYL